MAQKALLVIDMLNDFIDEEGSLYCGPVVDDIIPVIKDKLDKAREQNVPVIYICDNHRPDDAEFDVFEPHCIEGSEGGRIYDEVAPEEGDVVIQKRRFSGFYGTDLDLTLRERGIQEVELVGVCTNICVLYTAADARMREYEVVVDVDAVASFDEQAHESALKEIENTLGGKVVR